MRRKRRKATKRTTSIIRRRRNLKKRRRQKGKGLFSGLGQNLKYIWNSYQDYSRKNSLLNVHVP